VAGEVVEAIDRRAALRDWQRLGAVLDADEDDLCSSVRALGVDAARERAEALLAEALAELSDMGERAEPLRGLVRFAVRRRE